MTRTVSKFGNVTPYEYVLCLPVAQVVRANNRVPRRLKRLRISRLRRKTRRRKQRKFTIDFLSTTKWKLALNV